MCFCQPPQRNQINLLQNGRDYDLKQIENAFRDPEDGFWEKNSSEGIVGNSEVYYLLEIQGQCGSVATQ